jgi:hypothetical protein
MPTNAERAAWAKEACDAFDDAAGMRGEDLPSIMTDLAVNLLHLADQEGLCVEGFLERVQMHYDAETGDEKEWSQ